MILALEFYSGIGCGGLHLALQRSGIPAKIIRAFDWDPAASEVYTANFGKGIVRRTDISQLTAEDLLLLNAEFWLLSPACQPYTVLNQNAQGASDPRAQSFRHLVHNVLPDLAQRGCHPSWILVENVAGFEHSTTRQALVDALTAMEYITSEVLLTPLQFGIPNSRLRYYCLAKRRPREFKDAHPQKPFSIYRSIPGRGPDWIDPRLHPESNTPEKPLLAEPLSDYLDPHVEFEKYAIPDKILKNKAVLFDIIKPSSKRSCCFTRGYTRMIEGTSILQMNEKMDTSETFSAYIAAVQESTVDDSTDSYPLHILRPLGLRYFTPNELLRIFHFNPPMASIDSKSSPPDFAFYWPESTSLKTRYRLIGNSVNVKVVAELIRYLFEGDTLIDADKGSKDP